MSENRKQTSVSIDIEEWELAEKVAKREGFKTPTAWIRYLIRKNAKGA